MSGKPTSTRSSKPTSSTSTSPISLPLILLSLLALGFAIYHTVWDTLRAEIHSRTGYPIERQFWLHGQALYDDVRSGKYELPKEIKDLKARLWDSYFEQGLKWGQQWADKGRAVYEEYAKKS